VTTEHESKFPVVVAAVDVVDADAEALVLGGEVGCVVGVDGVELHDTRSIATGMPRTTPRTPFRTER